jgi:hypothetical protein
MLRSNTHRNKENEYTSIKSGTDRKANQIISLNSIKRSAILSPTPLKSNGELEFAFSYNIVPANMPML